jgi:hypothetical protein
MPGFVAADIAEPLEYDFTKYFDKAGVIREPTDKQIVTFQKAFRKEMLQAARELGAVRNLPDVADMDPDEFLAALEKTSLDDSEATIKRQAKLYADLCSSDPTAADLLKLPLRVRLGFYRWLQGEIMNPEAGAGAGANGQKLALVPPAAG